MYKTWHVILKCLGVVFAMWLTANAFEAMVDGKIVGSILYFATYITIILSLDWSESKEV